MRKLMTISVALVVSLFTGTTSFAKAVDENTAKTVGSNFLISMGVPGVRNAADLSKVYVATDIIQGQTINDYYVFNIVNGNGYVMVSGDDLYIPILSYSKEGLFDINNMAPAAKDWIEGYQKQISYVVANNAPFQESAAGDWAQLMKPFNRSGAKTTAVTPLVTTKWNQDAPYNWKDPGTGATKAYTGCVATAMAQIMKFWNWPVKGTGSHSYTAANYAPAVQTANFGITEYGWSGMPNTIASNNINIATLMYHAGVGVDMDFGYSASGSGAYSTFDWSPITNCAEYALKAYFHYKPTLKGLSRDATPGGLPAIVTPTWISYLKTELDAGRPMYYSGRGSSGGHAWVCDGYDASNNMHFNFGWGGASDGYYSVNNVNPPALGAGGGGGNFNTNQNVIIGIQPDTYPTSTDNIKLLAHLNCTTSSPMQYAAGFSIVTKILNGTSSAYNGDFCVQVFNSSNVQIGTASTITGQHINAGDSSAALTFSSGGMTGMVPGQNGMPGAYSYRVFYRPTGSGTWTAVGNNGNFINYNQLEVEYSQIIYLTDSLHLSSHTIARGAPLSLPNTKIGNSGSGAFSGSIQAILVNCFTGYVYPVQTLTGQYLGAGAIGTFNIASPSVTAPGGTYVLAVQHLPGGTGAITTGANLYQNPVPFYIVSGVDVLPLSQVAENINVYPNPANDKLNIDLMGADVNSITVSDISGRVLMNQNVSSNETVVNMSVAELAAGMYFVQLHSGAEVVTKKIVIAK